MIGAFSNYRPSIWNRAEDWPFEPSGLYFLAHAAQILYPGAVGKLRQTAGLPMRRMLADGKLHARALLSDGTLVNVPPAPWVVDENFEEWFSSCQITNVGLFGSGVHPLAGITYHWLFLDKAELDAMAAPKVSDFGHRTTAGRTGFKRRLIELMEASPNQRTISKDQQIEIGTREFNLSGRDASGVREQVLREVADHVRAAWSKRGPTILHGGS